MAKIRLSKNELKRQKEDLKRFLRYLPMLQLKKRQLQAEIIKIHQAIAEAARAMEQLRAATIVWVDVFAQNISLAGFCTIKTIRTSEGNVAGIDVPLFEGVIFDEKTYDFMTTPLWVDAGIDAVKGMLTLKAKLQVLHKQLDIIKEELRITTQRVNLFEKIKIPQAREHIRVIQIYLGEVRTAEVVRGKIAKAKIERKRDTVNA
jgi:V/A-type H+-transporting ATPase subunit D